MGFFKKVVQFVKDTHSLEAIAGSLTGAAMGFVTGGIPGAAIGAVGGGLTGTAQHKAAKKQEQAQQAQTAAMQQIAEAQNPVNLVTAVTPTASTETAQISEENMASEAKRRYSFSKTLYKSRSRLGSAGGSAIRTTLG